MKAIILSLLAIILNFPAEAQEGTLFKPIEILYPNRANELFVHLPDKVAWQRVEIRTENGNVEKSHERGHFTFVPKRNITRTVNQYLEVWEGKKLIQKLIYQIPYSLVRVTPSGLVVYEGCKERFRCEVLEGGRLNPNVSVKVEGGRLLDYEVETDYATIVPEEGMERLAISVYADSQLIGTESLPVQPVPKPEPQLYFGNYPIDYEEGIHLNFYREMPLIIKFSPERIFATQNPTEANYLLNEGAVTLARGREILKTISLRNQNSASLESLFEEAQGGDRLVVELRETSRISSAGQNIPVQNLQYVFTIPLHTP